MPLDVDALLAGPRGRRLCLAFAQGDSAVDTDDHIALRRALIDADDPDDVARFFHEVTLGPATDSSLMQALETTVDSAMYWQAPDGEDGLAATPAVRRALRRVAEHIAASPATRWWSSPIDLAGQFELDFAIEFDGPPSAVPERLHAVDELRRWLAEAIDDESSARVERPIDPAARWSGFWWSSPTFARLTTTTRSLEETGPIGLSLVEDGPDSVEAVVSALMPPPTPRIFEIDGPDAWVDLCRRYPLDLTASRRHDWYRATGRAGAWVVPDFSAVARDVDAVHLSVAGYLTTAGRALPVDDERATVLAGWNPDETYWLVDVETDPASRRMWRRDRDDDVWRAESGDTDA